MAEKSAPHSWLGSALRRNQGRKQVGQFEDVLSERNFGSDFTWAARSHKPPSYRFHEEVLSPNQIKEAIINSDNVKYGIKILSEELGVTELELHAEAESILKEMGHNLSLRTVRTFGYFIKKVMKSIYRHVFVNREGIEQLSLCIKEYPVVLLPSHRSYADFLLMSYICYDYDLPLPVIASAIDFMNMNFFGEVLRNCGAFFIRRSFASDKLYWLIFTQYVKFHVRKGQHPVEFYLEGTRSRTAKTLSPKTGMLGSILESWFTGDVPDIYLVPVTISHDRILEELLYAYELLGIPKPKESTSGLIKARHILSEDFGNVHLFFNKPISLRQLAQNHIDRSLHNLQCRLNMSLFPHELAFIKRVSHHLVAIQQQHAVISPWCLVATILLLNPQGLTVSNLLAEVEWFNRLLNNLGAFINYPAIGPECDPAETLRDQLHLHQNLVNISRKKHSLIPKPLPPKGPLDEEDLVQPMFSYELNRQGHNPIRAPSSVENSREPQSDLLDSAALNLQMGSYRNQLMHLLIREALIASLVNGKHNDRLINQDLLESNYILLEDLFKKEFIIDNKTPKENFGDGLRNLVHMGGIVMAQQSSAGPRSIDLDKSQTRHVALLSRVVEPFILGYWLVSGYFLHQVKEQSLAKSDASKSSDLIAGKLSDRDWAKRVQTICFALIAKDKNFHSELAILSLDLLTNAVTSLRKHGLLSYENLESEHQLLGSLLGDRVSHISLDHYWTLEKTPSAKL